jgi:galactoside O-acetyltransferase
MVSRILSYGKHVTLPQLRKIGVKFSGIGHNIQVSERAIFHNPQNITLGDNIRIDDNVLLSATGPIILDNYIHIARGCQLYSGTRIHIHDFSGLSSDTKLYGITDNYDGSAFTNPTCPPDYRNIIKGDIILNKHVIIGTSTIILPNVVLADGAAIGAMSLINKKNVTNIQPWTIWAGNPLKFISARKQDCLKFGEICLANPTETR